MSKLYEGGGGGNVVPATSSTLGGVKAGNGVTIAGDGTLSVTVADLGATSTWDALTTYGLAGPVAVYDSGSTYISVTPSGPGAPAGAQQPDPANGTYWKIVALEGTAGPTGPANDDALALTLFLMGAP